MGASCHRDELLWGLVVTGTSCYGGQLSRGRVVMGASCHWDELLWGLVVTGTSYYGGQLSPGRVVKGLSCHGGKLSRGLVVTGVSCHGAQLSRGLVVTGLICHGSQWSRGQVVMGTSCYRCKLQDLTGPSQHPCGIHKISVNTNTVILYRIQIFCISNIQRLNRLCDKCESVKSSWDPNPDPDPSLQRYGAESGPEKLYFFHHKFYPTHPMKFLFVFCFCSFPL